MQVTFSAVPRLNQVDVQIEHNNEIIYSNRLTRNELIDLSFNLEYIYRKGISYAFDELELKD
jgi:hypothetical protein